MAIWQWMAIQPSARQRFTMQALSTLLLLIVSVQTVMADSGVVNKVMVELRIEGLSKDGCIVEIEPGHPGCKFKRVRYKVEDERVLLQPIEVTSMSLDRDCSFAITIKEPGMPEYKVRRGLRLTKPAMGSSETPESRITCHLATPSQVQQARIEEEQSRTKAR